MFVKRLLTFAAVAKLHANAQTQDDLVAKYKPTNPVS